MLWEHSHQRGAEQSRAAFEADIWLELISRREMANNDRWNNC